MWGKIKTVMAWIGGILLAVLGYLFISKKKTETDVAVAKKELDEAKKETDEVVDRISEAEKIIKQAQKQTDEEVKHAKDIEISDDPDAVIDALNDILDRIRGESGGNKQQDCDGCSGRN